MENTYACRDRECTYEVKRKKTPAQKRAWKRKWDREEKESNIMHACFRSFTKKFMDDRGKFKPGLRGYELMCAVEDWAKKWPDDAIHAGCDDSHFTSSDIWFILHRVKRRLWGTTVIVLTQCDGQEPIEFFLYPGHAFRIMMVLQHLEKFAGWDKIANYLKRERRKPKWRNMRVAGVTRKRAKKK